jgi:hypothetical protein
LHLHPPGEPEQKPPADFSSLQERNWRQKRNKTLPYLTLLYLTLLYLTLLYVAFAGNV